MASKRTAEERKAMVAETEAAFDVLDALGVLTYSEAVLALAGERARYEVEAGNRMREWDDLCDKHAADLRAERERHLKAYGDVCANYQAEIRILTAQHEAAIAKAVAEVRDGIGAAVALTRHEEREACLGAIALDPPSDWVESSWIHGWRNAIASAMNAISTRAKP